MKKNIEKLSKCFLLALAITCSLLSIVTVVKATAPYSWAQCGADSYVECSGGTRCTSTDNVGCRCYDKAGRTVSRHSCREADL